MGKILISGAGIAGLALGHILKKFHIPCTIIEKRNAISSLGLGIALPANAVHAIRLMGLGKKIDELSHTVNKIIYCEPSGKLLSQASLLEEPLSLDKFVGIKRADLYNILKTEIEDDIHFETTIREIRKDSQGYTVSFDSTTLFDEKYDGIVGADGVHSSIRNRLFPNARLNDHGITFWRWISQYPTQEIEPTYFLGKENVFMAFPISQNEINCYAHVLDPPQKYLKTTSIELIQQFFSSFKGIAQTILKNLTNENIIAGRALSLSSPYFIHDNIALMGDASHVCTSILQQGVATALEDALVLGHLLKDYEIKEAFVKYEKIRKNRIAWIMENSDNSQKKFMENLTQETLNDHYDTIRKAGPFNVIGWKKLLQDNPFIPFENFPNPLLHS